MIKPDGVQRGLIADIIKRFEQKGFHMRGLKMCNVDKAKAETHYADLSSKCAPQGPAALERICFCNEPVRQLQQLLCLPTCLLAFGKDIGKQQG